MHSASRNFVRAVGSYSGSESRACDHAGTSVCSAGSVATTRSVRHIESAQLRRIELCGFGRAPFYTYRIAETSGLNFVYGRLDGRLGRRAGEHVCLYLGLWRSRRQGSRCGACERINLNVTHRLWRFGRLHFWRLNLRFYWRKRNRWLDLRRWRRCRLYEWLRQLRRNQVWLRGWCFLQPRSNQDHRFVGFLQHQFWCVRRHANQHQQQDDLEDKPGRERATPRMGRLFPQKR